jgi:hypothetical protein
MKSHLRLLLVAAAVAALACLFWSPRVAGCGPMAVELALNYNPDLPKNCGDIGVLPGNSSYRALYIAYRCMEGLPLSAEHRHSLENSQHGDEEWGESAVHQAWLAARDKMPNPPARVERYRRTENGTFSVYLNCSDDAFRAALGTSKDRMARFGPDSKEFAAWLEGQDRVFANCGGGPAAIPDPLPESFGPLLRADRRYQIAAAHFYAGHFDVAEALFLEIGKDASSPWRQFGPYLSARCLIRKGTLVSGENGPNLDLLAQADARLRSVLQDPDMSRVHTSARGLLQLIHLRLQPVDSAKKLGAALAKRDLDADFPQQFVDYLYLLSVAEVKTEGDDFDEWIFTVEYGDSAALLNRWKQTHSPAWLATAIERAQYGKPGWQEALSASSAVGPDSSAFPTVAFHRIRLELEAGKIQPARAELDRLLSATAHRFSRPVRNLLRAERMKIARNLDEFLRDAPRTPVQGGGDVFDDDAAAALTKLTPLAVLAKAAASPRLPLDLRREVAQAAWVRAVVLDDDETAQAVARTSTAFAPHLSEYLKEKDANARRSAALLTLLRFPGLHPGVTSGQPREKGLAQIDSYRHNWWCESKPDSPTQHWEGEMRILYPDGKASPPRFLNDAEKRAAAQGRRKLAALPTAPNYLSAAAIAWAKRSPDDPRVPEALHLAVRTTRYGCVDDRSGPLSKEAFRLLHSRYPKSKWTRNTPYWFGEQ